MFAGLLSPADLKDGTLDTVIWYPVGRYAVYPKQVRRCGPGSFTLRPLRTHVILLLLRSHSVMLHVK